MALLQLHCSLGSLFCYSLEDFQPGCCRRRWHFQSCATPSSDLGVCSNEVTSRYGHQNPIGLVSPGLSPHPLAPVPALLGPDPGRCCCCCCPVLAILCDDPKSYRKRRRLALAGARAGQGDVDGREKQARPVTARNHANFVVVQIYWDDCICHTQ